VAEGRDPRVVEPIVDADVSRAGDPRPALTAIAGDRDERRDMADARHDRGVFDGPFPRQRQREQAGMPRRRLDDVPVATGPTPDEFE
jgi:hypothetical protein